MPKKKLEFDKIGYWSELKIEIIEKYANAYSKVIAAQKSPRLEHFYVDAFAGAGEHVRKLDSQTVMGSPLAALKVQPPFHHYTLIELEPLKVGYLRTLVGTRPNVDIRQGELQQSLT